MERFMITLDAQKLPENGCKRSRRKVYYAYYDREWGSPHPVIRLGGKYLQVFGFNIGDAIEVHLDHGRITIVKVQDADVPTEKEKA
jgi:hypothetical protein